MILYHKNNSIKPELLTTKKELSLSEEFSFIPIHYQKKDLVIQTPPLFIPYEIQKYSEEDSKEYIHLSFQNFSRNQVSQTFIDSFLEPIYTTLSAKYKERYHFEHFVKKSHSSDWMRFKLSESTQFFNQNKEVIHKFPNKLFGSFIIHLSGLWIMNHQAWFQWTILQGRINVPVILKEYAFIDEIPKRIIPPPPPLPPPDKYKRMVLMGVPQIAVDHKKTIDKICAKDLQNVCLRKCQSINKPTNDSNHSFKPSVDEIKIALQSLQKIHK
jgi:hypothetical protein